MKISSEQKRRLQGRFSALERDRLPWWQHWRELANYYLPRRYRWLLSKTEVARTATRSPYITDSTGTKAARTLAAGMMNGITSPSRPWFKLRIPSQKEESLTVTRWTEEVERRMLMIMSESNFYNSMAVAYLDLVVFGTAAVLIYENYEDVIRCFNPALGEFYLSQDYSQRVNVFARTFTLTVAQVVEEFGEENCSDRVKSQYKLGGAGLETEVVIHHLIEPNLPGEGAMPEKFKFREVYWETSFPQDLCLRKRGYLDIPGFFPRWELSGNEAYGTSPASDTLSDVLQLQQETKRKAQGLDKMVSPPVIATTQLANRPMSLLPGGTTFVSDLDSAGAKPVYTVNLPIGELRQDIQDIQTRVRQGFFNELFADIMNLQTVRSATEISARQQERLVLMGSILQRFENEALDPAIKRIYSIMSRNDLLPEPPEEISDAGIEIQFVSILAVAQRAAGVAPTERFLSLIGALAPNVPDVLAVPDFMNLLRGYARDTGVPATGIKTPEEVQGDLQQSKELVATREAANTGKAMAQAGKLMAETDIGGGQSAVEAVLGGM